jgi:mono/diheme cytochrome c family protein
MSEGKRRWFAQLGGVGLGVAVFVGLNLLTGRAIVPTVASVGGRGLEAAVQAPAVVGPPYQTVCGPCHQLQGQGIPYAFPPLAGSPWMTGDPETPIRIVLLGMSGEVDVNGTKFNLVMPPPPAMSDAQIAEAITYARTNFGNKASAVDAAQVKQVRDSLAGRAAPWTATELLALRSGAAAPAGAAATAGAGGAPAP